MSIAPPPDDEEDAGLPRIVRELHAAREERDRDPEAALVRPPTGNVELR